MTSDNITVLLTQLGMRLDEQERQIKKQQQRIEEQQHQIEELTCENERLKAILEQQGSAKGSKPPIFKDDYSVDTHTGSGKSKRGHQSTGRRPHQSKQTQVDKQTDVYETGVDPSLCVERRRQYVWRIIDGKARYICYRLLARAQSQELPNIAGVRNSWSEYGIEIIVIVAYLHYWVGLSLDRVCEVMQFFTGLELSKSQVDALLTQLSQDWQE
ncbi:hypothetical protein, partial [Leptothoe spongobia]